MAALTPHQIAARWFAVFMGTTLVLFGGVALYFLRGDGFNPGWIFFIVILLSGVAILLYSGRFSRSVPNEVPESEKKTGLRETPYWLVMIVLILAGMIITKLNRNDDVLGRVGFCMLLGGMFVLGLMWYRFETLTIRLLFVLGDFVVRGKTAKNVGIVMMIAALIGVCIVWLV